MLERLELQFYAELDRLIDLAPRIGLALLLIALAWIVGRLLAAGVNQLLVRGQLIASHRKFIRQSIVVLCVLAGVAIGLDMIGLGSIATGLLAGGGMTAVVLAFAFRDIGENLMAGLFLAFNRPFEIGQVIRCGEHEGTVRGIAIRTTHIRTADGRDIFIPNARVFSEPLINSTRDGLLRSSYTFGIDWADDASRARELLLGIVRAEPGVLMDPPPAVWVSELAPNTVDLTVFFWVNVLAPDPAPPAVRSAVLDACRKALMEQGYTVSSNVSTSVVLDVPKGIELART